MDTRKFLETLFSRAPGGYVVEIRAPGSGLSPSSYFTDPTAPELRAEFFDKPRDLYFSVGLREPRGEIAYGAFVWVDCDNGKPERWLPEPTVAVQSSAPEKAHAYWCLDGLAPIGDAVRLSKLARLAYDGDPKVCEPARVMRLVGSHNMKYDPPLECKVASASNRRYTIEGLEEQLVAAVLANYWEGGNRHAIALASAALLSRANWTADRAERVILAVIRHTGDDDERDRMAAVRGTFDRAMSGELVSTSDLKDAMDTKAYKELVDALGIAARDGDLLLDGERIGKAFNAQRDLAQYVVSAKDWAATEGALARWDGKVWKVSHSEALVSAVFDVLSRLRQVESGVEQEFQATAGIAKAIKDVIVGRIRELELAPMDPHLLPLSNGVLDLTTRDLRPYEKDVRARWSMDIEYDPSARCPRWVQFLEEAAPDEASFLQEWIGYSLEHGNPWQRMLWLFGPSNTGKSTFLNTVKLLFGPAAVSIKSGNIDDYGVASMAAARVALCAELSARVLKTDRLKSLVAQDPLVGRHPYGRPFSCTFAGKLIWASNSLPPVDQAEGLWRRIVVVPFVRVPKKVDPLIWDKLAAEMSGILNWALDGRDRVTKYTQEGTWDLPESVVDTVEEYREAADTFAAFAKEELVWSADGEIAARELYARYTGWSKNRGYQPEPFGPVFWRELKKQGLQPDPTPKRINGRLVRVWRGATLAPEVFG